MNMGLCEFYQNISYETAMSDFHLLSFHVKKRVLEIVLPRVMHIIQAETLGKMPREREKSRQESWIGL